MAMKVILYIFAFLAFCYIMGMIYNISQFFKEKRNYQFMLNQKENATKSKLNMLERVDSTLGIINIANILIDNEVGKTIQGCIALNSKYDVSRLDKDVKIIATTVFESLKPEIFASQDIIINDTFLMQHITDEAMLRMIAAGKELNKNIVK